MFDKIDEQKSNQENISVPSVGMAQNLNQNISKPAEDILAEVDQPIKSDFFQPKIASASLTNLGGNESNTSDSKKFFVLGIIIISFILIIGISYFCVKFYLDSRKLENNLVIPPIATSTIDKTLIIGTPTIETLVDEVPVATTTTTSTEPIIATTTQQSIDTDQDGLADDEEQRLGTDINSVDSDNDGLFDREEIKVFNTNPLNADTDGDNYLDGDEVKKGYNPKGVGKLFEM